MKETLENFSKGFNQLTNQIMKARFGELNHKINMIVIVLSHSKTQ